MMDAESLKKCHTEQGWKTWQASTKVKRESHKETNMYDIHHQRKQKYDRMLEVDIT